MLDAELRGAGTDGLCERRRRLRKRIVEQRLWRMRGERAEG